MELALELRNLEVDSVPLNFLNPRPGTPLAEQADLTAADCLKIIALFRLVLPTRDLIVCGGRAVNLGERQDEIFRVGANGVMLGNYLTTAGRPAELDLDLLQNEGLVIRPPPTSRTPEPSRRRARGWNRRQRRRLIGPRVSNRYAPLEARVAALDEAGLRRQLVALHPTSATTARAGTEDLVVFCSNDYLGLAAHPEVQAAFLGAGAGSARLVSGNRPAHAELEEALGERFGRPATLSGAGMPPTSAC